MSSTIISMVVYKYNRLGTEGLDSEGYSGVSFGYSTDYPESIMRALKSQRKLITI
nr:MAG TPA: Head Tail Connector Protein [Caudoviricetes sp.]